MSNLLRIIIRHTALFFVFSLLLASLSNANAVSFTVLRDLTPDTSSSVNGISLDGEIIVGSSSDQAVQWKNNSPVGLGYLSNSDHCSASSISMNNPVIVGSCFSSGMRQAFRWIQGTGMVGLGFLTGDDHSRASGVSGDGNVIVGTSYNSNNEYKAFLWAPWSGGMVNIGNGMANGISFDGEVIVGQSNGEAFRWTQSTGMVGLGDLPGGDFYSSAAAVSSDGSVVVGYGDTSEGRRAFLWTQSEGIVDIADLPGSSEVHAVSGDGSVVVGMVSGRQYPFEFEAFIWDKVNGMRYLKDVLVNGYGLDLTDWHLEDATGISYDGTKIVGTCTKAIPPYGSLKTWVADIGERAVKVYGEFSGFINQVGEPEHFHDEIGIGTIFSGTFSYSSDPLLTFLLPGPVYIDNSFAIDYTFFGNTENHHLHGSVALNTFTSSNSIYFGYIIGWQGSIAETLPSEGGLGFDYLENTLLNHASFPIRIYSDDFLGGSIYLLYYDQYGNDHEIGGTIESLTAQTTCLGDNDYDHDVDGSDLKQLVDMLASGIIYMPNIQIVNFTKYFGQTNCY